MRISDWSSDVCSSDLIVAICSICALTFSVTASSKAFWLALPSASAASGIVLASDWRARSAACSAVSLTRNSASISLEIGRASCRERVCQYVYISVVEVTLKKQNQHQQQDKNHI